jgi:potassium-transporting ATPase ATP-binding subunit
MAATATPPTVSPAPPSEVATARRSSIFSRDLVLAAIRDSFPKLDPRLQFKNPVMFIVELGSVITTAIFVLDLVRGQTAQIWFVGTIAVWLWLTVLFANFAEAIAEGRGKAQASALRATRTTTTAHRRTDSEGIEDVPAPELQKGDVVVVSAGEVIPADGEVIEGVGSVDESAITGESAPVIRESGGDRSAVTGGTKLLSDQLVVLVTQEPGKSFLDRMIALVEGAERRKTPNEIALNILLSGLTITFLAAVVTLRPFAIYAGTPTSTTVLIALLVALIPTTIGALLSAIGIAGMDRLVQRNVLALSGRAVEASGDVDVLLLDKTGTITLGNRQATEFVPVDGVGEPELVEAAQLSSLADETPEGRSIVVLAKERYGLRGRELSELDATFIPFSATTRMSGVDVDGRQLRKGAADAIKRFVEEQGGQVPAQLDGEVDEIARAGGTPLVVAQNNFVLGVIHLKDVVKGGMNERFDELRKMGIRTVMITGDNRVTAAVIAQEAGVDDFLAEATPEAKMALIKEEQSKGRMVAMTGDGTNDAPALAQADVGVAMNAGTSAAKEAGNMVDLDNNPTKLIEVVEVGKQLLITRGALTTFSIANDIAKYFAILPAMFAFTYAAKPGERGPLNSLNVMQLGTPKSAIVSAIIFNALIIPALVPLALRGVKYRAIGATALLRRNLLIYGLGGMILPFVGIKLIDLVVHNFFGA